MFVKKLAAALAVPVAFVVLLFAQMAGSEMRYKTYTLFGGSDVDSTEQLSAWVPVRGAKRVYIRTFSTHAAFHASTDADSTFADSIGGFIIQFSDSSAGRLVGPGGQSVGGAADSVVIAVTVAGDTARVMAGAMPLPINKALRAPANGSGLITVVYPTKPGAATTAGELDPDGFIAKDWMRVRCTPLRRMTVTGGQSTAGKRVNGLKGLKMTAEVVIEEN